MWKLTPESATTVVPDPVVIADGVSAARVGAAEYTATTKAFDGVDGADGLVTRTVLLPGAPMTPDGRVAEMLVGLETVVANAAPFHVTAQPDWNPEPEMDSVPGGDMTENADGATDAIVGAGVVTVTTNADVEPPPGAGVSTVT